MMLFLQGFADDNVYMSDYKWAGQSGECCNGRAVFVFTAVLAPFAVRSAQWLTNRRPLLHSEREGLGPLLRRPLRRPDIRRQRVLCTNPGRDERVRQRQAFSLLLLAFSPLLSVPKTATVVNRVFFSDPSRLNTTWAQTAYDKGLADAALAHNLPIRIDQQLPSDILASVLYGARTVARCTSDANPCGGEDPSGPYATRGWPHCSAPSRYAQLAGVALLLAPLHVRPFTDDIWTIETQGDPRTGAGARRPTVVHDLIVSTLSAGPVGFADLVNHTNASLLGMATRQVTEATERVHCL